MTIEQFCELMFSDVLDKDIGKFEDLPKELKVSKRKDLCGLMLLDKLVPGKADMILSANHEEVVLSVPLTTIAKRATEEDVRNLVRCGISISPYAPDLIVVVGH